LRSYCFIDRILTNSSDTLLTFCKN